MLFDGCGMISFCSANENFGPSTTFDQRIGEDNKGHQLLMKMGKFRILLT